MVRMSSKGRDYEYRVVLFNQFLFNPYDETIGGNKDDFRMYVIKAYIDALNLERRKRQQPPVVFPL